MNDKSLTDHAASGNQDLKRRLRRKLQLLVILLLATWILTQNPIFQALAVLFGAIVVALGL